jgi:hypothetical protein
MKTISAPKSQNSRNLQTLPVLASFSNRKSQPSNKVSSLEDSIPVVLILVVLILVVSLARNRNIAILFRRRSHRLRASCHVRLKLLNAKSEDRSLLIQVDKTVSHAGLRFNEAIVGLLRQVI